MLWGSARGRVQVYVDADGKVNCAIGRSVWHGTFVIGSVMTFCRGGRMGRDAVSGNHNNRNSKTVLGYNASIPVWIT